MEGAERSILDVIDYLVARGVEVSVILPRDGLLTRELNKRHIRFETAHNKDIGFNKSFTHNRRYAL